MQGEIMLDFQKSTKISLSRYIQLMERQLGSKIAGPVQFREIPNRTQLFQGWIDTPPDNSNNLLVFKLKLHCKRVVSDTGEHCGEITLQGTQTWGGNVLTFNICLLRDFKYSTQEDMMLIPFQDITIKIPPTHLTVNSRGGSFRLSFGNNFSCWEKEEVIQERVVKILEKRKTQNVKIPIQGPGFDPSNMLPSAPMKPTPYVYQTSSNPDWVYEDQTSPGGLIQRGKWTPSVGGQQGPHHVEWSHGGVSRDTDQYDPPVVTETPCIGGVGPPI